MSPPLDPANPLLISKELLGSQEVEIIILVKMMIIILVKMIIIMISLKMIMIMI